jgi:hypothetical protein
MKNDDPDAGRSDSKAGFIENIRKQYQERARGQILKEYPQIQDQVTSKVQERQNLRMPSL